MTSAAELLDALDSGVLLLDGDLSIEYANARWRGWLVEELAPHTPIASLIDDDSDGFLDELRDLLNDGEPRTMSLRLRAMHADVSPRRVTAIARRAGGRILLEARGVSDDDRLSMHDIARRLAEVNDMAEVLSTLCDIATRQCAASGAAVLRVTGRYGEVVAAAGDLSIARGRSFALEGSLLHEAMAGQGVINERNYKESGRPLMRVVPELSLGPIMVSPLRAHGETLGVIAVARGVDAPSFRPRDMARLRLLADHAALAVHKSLLLMQAQSADRAKGRFLATMSHELRTPLTALAGYNELLADQVIGPLSEPQLDVLERMRSVTAHLSAMIEEILAFTSLEEGRETLRPTEFLAADLVNSAVAVIEPLAEQKRLRVDTRLPPRHVRMTSDIDKSRQILVNLLGNAVKFTDSGTISVRVTLHDDAIRIEVKDTGIGIPQSELAHLFRPFAQVDTGLTRRHGGTGLGLYISRRLATMLHGHIEVSSAPNVGSTFAVVLPLHLDAAKAGQDTAPA